MHKILTLGLLLAFVPPAVAQEDTPWTHPDVLKAAIEIRMTQDQRPRFRSAITTFLQGFNSDVRRLLNVRNPNDLPRKIASKRRSRVKALDSEVQEFLTDEQMSAYEAYRDMLLEKMDERTAKRWRRR